MKWDLKQAHWIRDHLQAIEHRDDQQRVINSLAQFEAETAPILASLRQSLIHGDINDYNTLVLSSGQEEERVSGFIDFGDLVETSTICELAIAITYAIMDIMHHLFKPHP